MIQFIRVCKHYANEFDALKYLSLDIPRGSITFDCDADNSGARLAGSPIYGGQLFAKINGYGYG